MLIRSVRRKRRSAVGHRLVAGRDAPAQHDCAARDRRRGRATRAPTPSRRAPRPCLSREAAPGTRRARASRAIRTRTAGCGRRRNRQPLGENRPAAAVDQHGVCLAAFTPIVLARRGGHFRNAPDCRSAGRQIPGSRRACAAAALSRRCRASTASPSPPPRAHRLVLPPRPLWPPLSPSPRRRESPRGIRSARARCTPGRFTRTVRR